MEFLLQRRFSDGILFKGAVIATVRVHQDFFKFSSFPSHPQFTNTFTSPFASSLTLHDL